IIGYEDKPIIMGETGAGVEYVPSAATSLTAGVEWIADSCDYSFDGWLYWGYYPWPEDMNGKPWAALEDDELILKGMAPVNQPDPCTVPELAVGNIAFRQPARASRFSAGEAPGNVTDGRSSAWNAGDYAPQWIEIELDSPSTIQRVAMTTEQWPPGVTHHEVWARLADGKMVFLGQFDGFTSVDMNLAIELPVPLENVIGVRIETIDTPAWVAWREIEVISAPPPTETACLAETINPPPLYPDPVPGAESNGRITHSILVYLNGYYHLDDDITWWQTGGGTWIEDHYLRITEECRNNTPELAREARLVPVTFTATIPDNTTGEVFMAGDFGDIGIPNWLPWSVLLTQESIPTLQVTIPLPVGAEISYKYTRGGWESVEKGTSCRDVPERTFTVTDTSQMTITDEITAWADLEGCN
ncbi:MAG TPA: hypothetical protein VJ965_09640, partial [Anaerolineales bacterium]|nr:hypothetical protein [Anaerolineales bacterium]